MFAPTYFDHNASAPLEAPVLEAMLPYLRERCGNASSRHDYGRMARKAIDEARQQVAAAVGAHASEVIFTSGGSEANNLFLKGAAAVLAPAHGADATAARQASVPVVMVSALEHPCVRETAHELQRSGWQVREIASTPAGVVDVADYQEALRLAPQLVSVMLANNETGALQPLAELACAARELASPPWFHTDAVQALGKVDVDFRQLNAAGVHAATLSAHKIGGPQGAGALIVDKRVELRPLINGGGQERGLRSGTENVAAIVGFGAACALLPQRLAAMHELQPLVTQLFDGLQALGARVFAAEAARLPNTLYFAFPQVDGETLVGKLDRAGFAVASGSACSSANPEPSHVLRAMGVAPELARGAVRVSLGPGNTEPQVREFLATLNDTVFKLRRLTALAG